MVKAEKRTFLESEPLHIFIVILVLNFWWVLCDTDFHQFRDIAVFNLKTCTVHLFSLAEFIGFVVLKVVELYWKNSFTKPVQIYKYVSIKLHMVLVKYDYPTLYFFRCINAFIIAWNLNHRRVIWRVVFLSNLSYKFNQKGISFQNLLA